MARACPTNNNRNPQDSRQCSQRAGETNSMRKFRAILCVVRTAGNAALFAQSAVIAATRYSNVAHTQEPERSVDLSIGLAVNEDSDGGAAEVSLWVTNHGNRVACD